MFDPSYLQVLQNGLHAASLRQNVIANNLSNLDTPGFKASSVQFENILAQSLDQGANLPLLTNAPNQFGTPASDAVTPEITQNNTTSLRPDGNNVDIDQQMTDLAKNNLYNDSLTAQISAQLGILRMVISEKP
ncbi:MAG: flagellar basal body rod protein FlgB [Peptococcaceae bacterium]|nr:flagellar basal body rod protein FlgB [Peptococcaceae bacterium]